MTRPFARVSGEYIDGDPLDHACPWCAARSCDCDDPYEYRLTPEELAAKPREERELDLKRARITIARAFGKEPDPADLADVRLYAEVERDLRFTIEMQKRDAA